MEQIILEGRGEEVTGHTWWLDSHPILLILAMDLHKVGAFTKPQCPYPQKGDHHLGLF